MKSRATVDWYGVRQSMVPTAANAEKPINLNSIPTARIMAGEHEDQTPHRFVPTSFRRPLTNRSFGYEEMNIGKDFGNYTTRKRRSVAACESSKTKVRTS